MFQSRNYMSEIERNLSPDYDVTMPCGGEALGEQRVENADQMHRVEREWLDRLQSEQARHRAREKEARHQLSRLSNDLKSEQTLLTQEIQKSQEAKKGNQELRKKMSELVVKNSQLKKQNEAYQY